MSSRKLIFFLFAILFFGSLPMVRSADEFEEEDQEAVENVIGIDLGTTFSVVGIYQNGKVEIIANEQGNRITPSYVAFMKDGIVVGEGAKNQASRYPKNTIYASKRIIGRRFDEKSVQDDLKSFAYTTVNQNNKPKIRVHYKEEPKDIDPMEVAAHIIQKMKTLAEVYIGKKVKHAVITVPAYFNDAQRSATKNAGKIAGVNVIRIINEPTAAAIAYGIDKEKEANVLIFDLGGGTFDVSVLTLDNGVFEVRATNGNTHLGGEDFDLRLAEHLIKAFENKHKISLKGNKSAFMAVKREAERVKRILSSEFSAKAFIENLAENKNLDETVSRALFEKLCMKLFRKLVVPLNTVLADSGFKKEDINVVVLIGGSTRIPKVQQILQEFFPGKKLFKDINPDEAVAYGAAVQGFILSDSSDKKTEQMLLIDVNPISLGIETVGGVFTEVIQKNTAIPTSKTQTFTTNEHEQTTVTISVFQGGAKMVRHNDLLNRFDLNGIDKAPRGVPQIEVTFDIDANGILKVSAKDKASGKNKQVTVDHSISGYDAEEIKKMSENFDKDEDEKIFNRTLAKNRLDAALHKAQELRKEKEKELDEKDLKDLDRLVEETTEWLKNAKVEDTEQEDFEEKAKEVDEVVKEIGQGDQPAGEDAAAEEEEEAEEAKSEL